MNGYTYTPRYLKLVLHPASFRRRQHKARLLEEYRHIYSEHIPRMNSFKARKTPKPAWKEVQNVGKPRRRRRYFCSTPIVHFTHPKPRRLAAFIYLSAPPKGSKQRHRDLFLYIKGRAIPRSPSHTHTLSASSSPAPATATATISPPVSEQCERGCTGWRGS